MELTIDMTNKDVQVTRQAEPKLDQEGIQRTERDTGQLIWSVQVVVTDHTGGAIIKVAVAGDKPDLDVGEAIELVGLIAFPWSASGKHGVAYRALAIRTLED